VAVAVPVGGRVVRFDVTLVVTAGLEFALDNDVCLVKAGLDVSYSELTVGGNVRGPLAGPG
jgi:hypothetical protein